MVSGERCLAADDGLSTNNMKEMIGGCCVCSDERGWAENPLVYCDGHGCNVAVHQACYGIVQVPTGPWFCRKCESQERAARVRCELCPHKDGALKRTDNGGWAHVVCALYIPEVEFANVSTMEPIVLQSVPHDRYNKTCYICEDQGRESKAATGACMTCNKHGCRQAFHVTCAQFAGLLCEEQGSDADNVKYCGYCKYHHSKLKHKERDRHKPRHKKTMDMSPSLVLPNIMVPDKTYNSSSSVGGVPSLPASSQKRLDDSAARFTTANFQEVSSTHSSGSSKDGLAADTGKVPSEVKNKKNAGGSHAVGQRAGRKSLTSSGKPLPSAVVTMATSSTSASASTGPFHQGLLLTSASKTPSAPSSSDFLSFSDSSLRPGSGTTFSSPPSFSSCLVKPSSEGGASEGTTTLFGSLMSATTASAVGGKLYENSHSHTASETPSLGGSAGYKRPQPTGSGPGIGGAVAGGGEDGVKKKKKGNWRNRFGPCFTTDVKPSEPAPSLTLPNSSTVNTSSSTSSPSSSSSSTLSGRPGLVSSSGLGVGGGGAGAGAGAGGERVLGVMGVSGIQKSPSLLRNGSLQSSSSSTTAGPGVFSGADGSSSGTGAVTVGGGNSELSQQQQPTPSLAPPSPFTATAPLTSTASTHVSGMPGSVFNLAPSHMFGNRLNPNSAMAALIAQSEASPAVVGMLKSLHQLQEENRRLEEQIKSLTMKKERLQLLSAQLSVPFTPNTAAASDVKGAQLGATDSSLPVAAQDSMSCGGHSSSGSTSSLSTPPSVSQSPPQPQLNGVAVGATPAGLGGVAGLMGALGAGMGGIVGALNGVIQMPAGTAGPHTHTTGAAAGVTLPVTNSAARLGLLSEQHRLLLQQHQLQQLLSSQPSAEQQQVLLYQLMQQQQDIQQLHSLSSSAQIPSMPLSSTQLPINNLLPGAQNQGQSAITANPFLALQHAHTDAHAPGAQKPRLAEKAVGIAGQEKT
ncbi:hypothetical protein F2P81_019282 [Scophthalmus maximus]|uniref:Protein AF-10 n=1 Tax=Scophthalmus maximus TaxID=52904 RepID=A0A6A4S7E0_SCOMX|nr:hypothetical protein F2P81_019282 [Scophthalmus maximus]